MKTRPSPLDPSSPIVGSPWNPFRISPFSTRASCHASNAPLSRFCQIYTMNPQVGTANGFLPTTREKPLRHARDAYILSAMTKTYCDISALRYYRTPPRYFYALPPVSDFDTPFGRAQLRQNPVSTHIIGIPIHTLSFGGDRLTSTLVKQHLWTQKLPTGAIVETPFDVSVTSPLFTLLMLSTHLDPIQTALLIYEFTGTFSIFSPNRELDAAIMGAIKRSRFEHLDTWMRTTNVKGRFTDMWGRQPLLGIDDIHEFLAHEKGMRGRNKLAQAMRYVTGVTASPFEAKASMLIGASRRLGGLGLGGFKNNLKIELDDRARRICELKMAYGDIVWEKTPEHPMVIVECQGEMTHDSPERAQADDDRALALESMGAQVIRISYKQILDAGCFDLLAARLARALGTNIPPSSPQIAKQRDRMRRMLFGMWPYC